MSHRVLFMIQHLRQGGTEDHFHDLVSGLDPARIEPHVIHFDGPDGYNARKLEAYSHITKSVLPVTRAYDASGWYAAWQVRRYLRRHRIDAVVSFHFVADFVGGLATLGTRTQLISSRRDMGFTRTTRQIQAGRLLRHGVARYIAVSDAVRQAIARDERIDPAKIDVIYNGVDLAALGAERWNPAAERARLGIGEEEIVIGCVANFNPVKGHLNLVEAFGRLCANGGRQRLRLLLAGEGVMEQPIRARVAELGLNERVLLVGSSRAVAREFLMSDIVTLASETEGFSNSIIQAMALGRPVVATCVGGNPEAIAEGQTGSLVPPCDAQALAGALGRLVDAPALRVQMGAAGRERALAMFDKKSMIRQTEALIARVIARRA